MVFNRIKNRRRFIRRFYSERYLAIVLISFSFSVSFTRLFLEISGFPQLAFSDLHIAHVLWGGLALFISSLIPLIFFSQRAFDLSALLSGIGMGLFIDEVGKFFTRSNDYFHPAAAPVIYFFFLIILLTLTVIRKNIPVNNKTRLFHLVELYEEILEGDLSNIEYQRIRDIFEQINREELSDAEEMTLEGLHTILENEKPRMVADRLNIYEKIWNWWLKFEEGFINGKRINPWLSSSWLMLGIILVLRGLTFSNLASFIFGEGWILQDFFHSMAHNNNSMTWIIWLQIMGEIILGLCLVLAWIISLCKNYSLALELSFLSMTLYIGLINLFVFYFEQFSAIIFTSIQVMVLFLTARYRRKLSGSGHG